MFLSTSVHIRRDVPCATNDRSLDRIPKVRLRDLPEAYQPGELEEDLSIVAFVACLANCGLSQPRNAISLDANANCRKEPLRPLCRLHFTPRISFKTSKV